MKHLVITLLCVAQVFVLSASFTTPANQETGEVELIETIPAKLYRRVF